MFKHIALFSLSMLIPLSVLAQTPAVKSDAAVSVNTEKVKVAPKEPVEEIVSMPPEVNPMTGKAMAFEEKERQLREKTLDAQLAEQDVRIAKQKLDLQDTEQKMKAKKEVVKNELPAELKGIVSSKKQAVSKKSIKLSPVSSAPSVPAFSAPQLVGVMDSGNTRMAIFSYNGQTYSVGEGDSFPGGRVTNVRGDRAALNGVTYTVMKGTSVIDLPDTHQAAQPGSVFGQMQKAYPTPKGALPVPGLNATATQPVTVGSPVGDSSLTSPVKFPDQIYAR